jgi:WhiB family redox-sensing transcriptional regulator
MALLEPEHAKQALCRGKGPWPWITPENADKDTFNRAAAEAREICNQCPVQRECRVAGLKELRGTWGGTTYRERGF